MKCRTIIPLALVLSLLSGCAVFQVPARVIGPVPSQAPAPAPVLEQVSANGLVLRLLEEEQRQSPGKNVILSPLSIEMALGMAANGADGEAKKAVETLLGMDAATLNALLRPYLQKEDGVLSIANSMWFNEKLDGLIKGEFKDVLSTVYQAGEGSFVPHSEADAARINGWVKEKTREKIDSILTSDILTDDTLAVLINALYFDGKWADPFDAPAEEGKFYTPNGVEDVRLMEGEETTYFEHGGFTGFSKDYENGYEFIGILPDELGLDLGKLDIDAFLASETGAYDVDIRIPKFEIEYSNSLKQTLTELGLGSLFADHALDGLLTEEAIAGDWTAGVSDVLHKTYMKMYEEGTEAAAVTSVIVYGATCAMPVERQVKQVHLDRPFAFLIRDTQSGQTVFCGAINSVK